MVDTFRVCPALAFSWEQQCLSPHFVSCSPHAGVWSSWSRHLTWSCLPVIGVHCEVDDPTSLVPKSFLTRAMEKWPLSFLVEAEKLDYGAPCCQVPCLVAKGDIQREMKMTG